MKMKIVDIHWVSHEALQRGYGGGQPLSELSHHGRFDNRFRELFRLY